MKARIYGALAVLSDILTFLGAAYVLVNKGGVNAGYACVPMVFGMAFTLAYQKYKRAE